VSAKILLTGVPGVGKTTVIRSIAEGLAEHAAGFYTGEVREARGRVGFDIITLDGRRAALSRKASESRHRVGRYGVDVQAIDSVAVPAIEEALSHNKIVVIDEIGRMELFSRAFRESVVKAFDSSNPVIAVIMLKSHPFADEIKRRKDVRIIQVTEAKRGRLPREIMSELGFASE
jgi:nucleoside-triphosphatase